MKKIMMIKTISLLVLFAVLALPILSCGNGCAKETTEAPADTTIPSEDIAGITLDMLKNYKIIVPEDIMSELGGTSSDLIEQIEKYTGVKLSISDDFVKEGSDKYKVNEYEILLGKTNREESVSFHKTLKSKDYGYGIIGKKLIIAGHTATNVAESVRLFISNVLKEYNTDNEYVFKSDDNNIKTTDYKYNTLKIDGVDIYEYSIVYKNLSTNGENIIAEGLSKWIAENYGYVLNVYKDSTEYDGGYEIQIGDTKRITDEMKAIKTTAQADETKAYIQKNGNLIWLSGSDRTIIESSKSKLLEMIKAQSGENIVITLGASNVYNIKSQQLNVLNYNVRSMPEKDLRNPDDVLVSIRKQNPDIFGTNETTAEWLTKLNGEFGNEYTCVPGKIMPANIDAYNAIFYRTASYDLLESGSKYLSSTPDKVSKLQQSNWYRAFTYVILKDRTSGVRFMYINTHLDVHRDANDANDVQRAREARELQAKILLSFVYGYTDMPIIIGGDFNTTINGDGPKHIVGTGMFSSASEIADESIMEGGTGVSDAYTKRGTAVIDHIFVATGSVTVQKFEIVDNIMNGKYPSDHLPVQAYVTIWQCE